MLLANISSLSSDFGSRPVHNRNYGLLGKGALIVPLPAFLPSRINHVFRKRALLRFSDFSCIDRVAPKPSSRSPRQRLVAHLSYKPPKF